MNRKDSLFDSDATMELFTPENRRRDALPDFDFSLDDDTFFAGESSVLPFNPDEVQGNRPAAAPKQQAPTAARTVCMASVAATTGASAARGVNEGSPEPRGPRALDMGPERKNRGKKIALIAAACVLVLAGAGVALANTVFASHEPEPAPVVEPAYVKATVKADGVFLPGSTLSRGDSLSAVQPATDLPAALADQYYRAEFKGKTVYVQKKWVRLVTEPGFEARAGFAGPDALLFADGTLSGKQLATLVKGEKLQVIDVFADVAFVRNADGMEGYMAANKVLWTEPDKDDDELLPPDTTSSSNGYYWNGAGDDDDYGYGYDYGYDYDDDSSNSGGDYSDPEPWTPPATTPDPVPSGPHIDGDEMTMPASFTALNPLKWGVQVAYAAEKADAAASSSASSAAGKSAVQGVVLAAGTPSYLALLSRGSAVEVLNDDACKKLLEATADKTAAAATQQRDPWASGVSLTVQVNGNQFALDSNLLSLEGQQGYVGWKGYLVEGAVPCADYQLKKPLPALENPEVKVIDALGHVLLVQGNGVQFYVLDTAVSKEDPAAKKLAEEAEAADASGASEAPQGGSYQPSGSYTPNYSAPAPAPSPAPAPEETPSAPDPAPVTPPSSGGSPEWTNPIK